MRRAKVIREYREQNIIEWAPPMDATLDKTGTVKKVENFCSGKCYLLRFPDGKEFWYHEKSLEFWE